MTALSGPDLNSLWEYLNPKVSLYPPEYFLACEELGLYPYNLTKKWEELVATREMQLMLEKVGVPGRWVVGCN